MKDAAGIVQKRSTRTDPLLALLAIIVASALLPTALTVTSGALEATGLQPGLPILVLKALAVLSLVVCGVPPVQQLLKTFAAVHRRSKILSALPGPKYGFLGILPMHWRQRDIHKQLSRWADDFGPIYRIRIAGFHAVVVTDPALACAIVRSKEVDKFRFMYHFMDEFLLGMNVLTGPSYAHWRAVRKGVSPAFSTNRMRGSCAVITQCAQQLVRILAQARGRPQNIDNLLLHEGMDVIGRVAFNKEMGALDSVEHGSGVDAADVLLRTTKETTLRVFAPYRVFKPWNASVRAGKAAMKQFGAHHEQRMEEAPLERCLMHEGLSMYRRLSHQQHIALEATVRDLVKHMRTTEAQPGSISEALQAVGDPRKGQPLDDKAISTEVAALFFAGVDTTAHTITWILYLLTQHPEVEAKVAAELEAAGLLATSACPEPPCMTAARIPQLPYLQAVIKETLRMYPPVGIGQLRVPYKADIQLAGHLNIPRGTILWVPHTAIQTTKHNWDNSQVFQPERFLVAGAEDADPSKYLLPDTWYKALGINTQQGDATAGGSRPKRYFPFAEGPRDCLGQNMAKMSLVATTATLLAHLKFRLAPQMGGAKGVQAAEQYTLVTGLRDGMWVIAEPRVRAASDSLRSFGSFDKPAVPGCDLPPLGSYKEWDSVPTQISAFSTVNSYTAASDAPSPRGMLDNGLDTVISSPFDGQDM